MLRTGCCTSSMMTLIGTQKFCNDDFDASATFSGITTMTDATAPITINGSPNRRMFSSKSARRGARLTGPLEQRISVTTSDQGPTAGFGVMLAQFPEPWTDQP